MRDLSDDSGSSHFGDGLTYDLTVALARYQDLKVIPTLASPQSNGKPMDWRQIGADLNARFVLDGTLRRETGAVKVGNRLIDAKHGSILWCDEYRRELAPTVWIEIQEDVARRVVAQIASESGIIAQTLCDELRGQPPDRLDSHEAMLLFRHWHYRLTAETFVSAFAALERAVSEDPHYAPAWAALSNLHGTGYCLDVREPKCSLDLARSHAEKAMELEPCNQFVSLRWAYIHFLENRKEAFVQEAERGIALNPNNPHLGGLCGMLFTYFGLWERGLQLLDECAELNPNYPVQIHSGRFLYNLHLEEYEKAYDEAVSYGMPTFFWAWITRACALGLLGRRAEAEAAVSTLVKLKPDFPSRARELIGRYVKVEELVDRMLEGLRKAGLAVQI
jgi:TolB-like protein